MNWKLPALMLGSVAVLIGALVLSGVSPVEAAKTLFHGSLGTSAAVSGTLRDSRCSWRFAQDSSTSA